MGFYASQIDVIAVRERTDRLPDQPADNVVLLAAKAQADKLHGVAPAINTVNALWNSGVAPSLQPGATLTIIGAAATRYKVHGLHVDVTALTVGAHVTVRLYTPTTGVLPVNGYSQTFTVGTDPNDLWIINGTLEIDDILRVEVRSDVAGDDGRAIGYKYLLEAM